MPTAQKTERVAELKNRIQGSAALLFAEYRGLTVSEISDLRRSLREAETSLTVVKNTLMHLAAVEAGVEELKALISGPSAVAFVNGDPVAAAKRISQAAKQHPALVVKGGWMDGRVLSAEEANGLAELESREVMLSRIVGMMQADLSRAASMFQAVQAKFVSLMESLRDTLPDKASATSPTGDTGEPTSEQQGPGEEEEQEEDDGEDQHG